MQCIPLVVILVFSAASRYIKSLTSAPMFHRHPVHVGFYNGRHCGHAMTIIIVLTFWEFSPFKNVSLENVKCRWLLHNMSTSVAEGSDAFP